MLHIFLISAQIIILMIAGILLWQIWRFLKDKSIPEDEPLGETRVKYLTRRLTLIGICATAVAVLQIASAILRFLEII